MWVGFLAKHIVKNVYITTILQRMGKGKVELQREYNINLGVKNMDRIREFWKKVIFETRMFVMD